MQAFLFGSCEHICWSHTNTDPHWCLHLCSPKSLVFVTFLIGKKRCRRFCNGRSYSHRKVFSSAIFICALMQGHYLLEKVLKAYERIFFFSTIDVNSFKFEKWGTVTCYCFMEWSCHSHINKLVERTSSWILCPFPSQAVIIPAFWQKPF